MENRERRGLEYAADVNLPHHTGHICNKLTSWLNWNMDSANKFQVVCRIAQEFATLVVYLNTNGRSCRNLKLKHERLFRGRTPPGKVLGNFHISTRSFMWNINSMLIGYELMCV